MRDLGKLQEAVDEYRLALVIDATYEHAHYGLAVALEQSGQSHDTIAHFRQAIEIKQNYIETLNYLAWLWDSREV